MVNTLKNFSSKSALNGIEYKVVILLGVTRFKMFKIIL